MASSRASPLAFCPLDRRVSLAPAGLGQAARQQPREGSAFYGARKGHIWRGGRAIFGHGGSCLEPNEGRFRSALARRLGSDDGNSSLLGGGARLPLPGEASQGAAFSRASGPAGSQAPPGRLAGAWAGARLQGAGAPPFSSSCPGCLSGGLRAPGARLAFPVPPSRALARLQRDARLFLSFNGPLRSPALNYKQLPADGAKTDSGPRGGLGASKGAPGIRPSRRGSRVNSGCRQPASQPRVSTFSPIRSRCGHLRKKKKTKPSTWQLGAPRLPGEWGIPRVCWKRTCEARRLRRPGLALLSRRLGTPLLCSHGAAFRLCPQRRIVR